MKTVVLLAPSQNRQGFPSIRMSEMFYWSLGSIVLSLLLTESGCLDPAGANESVFRLVNGSDQCSGRVELKLFGQWGTVCDDNWDRQDAAVVCKMFSCGGFHGAVALAHFGMGEGPVWLDNLQCSGSEASLLECPRANLGKHNCDHSEDAGVICSDVDVRLVNGPDRCSGRVEIQLSGIWGTVCGDSWDMMTANVVCRMLGCGGVKDASGSAHFGRGQDPIWLEDLWCSGSEASLLDCRYSGLLSHNCNHDRDAGVICSDAIKNTSLYVNSSGEILEGSSVTLTCSSEAKPPVNRYTWFKKKGDEILKRGSGQNYTISNMRYEDSAQYFCQGQNDIGRDASPLMHFNVLYAPKDTFISISPSSVALEGSSVTLTCSSKANPPVDTYTWFKKNGNKHSERGSGQNYIITNIRSEDSGVYYCVAKNKHGVAKSSPVSLNVLCVDVRLVNGSNYCSGRLEVQLSGQWGTVCDNSWDMSDANVVCRMLGCGEAKKTSGSTHFGNSKGPVWLDEVQCFGSETSLQECHHGVLLPINCNPGKLVSVACNGKSKTPVALIVMGVVMGVQTLAFVIYLMRKKTEARIEGLQTANPQTCESAYETLNVKDKSCDYDTLNVKNADKGTEATKTSPRKNNSA